MRCDTIYGGALIAGALAGFVTMAMHPTGSQLMADVQHMAPVVLAVHALALAAIPVSFFGAIGLTRVLLADGEAPVAALVAYGMAQSAVMIAAVASGLLMPAIAARMVSTPGAERDLAIAFGQFTGSVNQAFAKVYVMASSAAILLWSASIIRHARLARRAGILGVVVAVLALVGVAIGHVRLDLHGFGAIVLTQGLWTITIGVLLIRSRPEAGALQR
ncbi:MAG: hypothetical protein H0U66_07355 [Gemmatimonadaceae bacterium]|nr:hypothetical protein [Gemmatimonadaceae bacterium]